LQEASKTYIFYFHTKSSPFGHPTEYQHSKHHSILNTNNPLEVIFNF